MKYWMVIEKVNQSGFRVPVNFSSCLIIHNKCGISIKWIVTVNRHIVQVTPCAACEALYVVLTREIISFEISSTLPVCNIAIDCHVIFFAAEHKKLRIRHILFYVKMQTAQLLWRFNPFCLIVPKTWLLTRMLPWT